MDNSKIIMKNGRPYRFDPKTGRSSPIDIDPRIVQQTGLSPEQMALKTEDHDNARSMGLEIKENDSNE